MYQSKIQRCSIDMSKIPDRRIASVEDLFQLSLLRVIDIGMGCNGHTPKVFPSDETFFSQPFSEQDKLRYPHLNTEPGKLIYTLDQFPERGPPRTTEPEICQLLQSGHVLSSWKNVESRLRSKASDCFRDVQRQMQDAQSQSPHSKSIGAVTVMIPHFYEAMPRSSGKCILLLERAIKELASSLATIASSDYIREFLQLYSFLRDPIGGLEKLHVERCNYFQRFTTVLLQAEHSTGKMTELSSKIN